MVGQSFDWGEYRFEVVDMDGAGSTVYWCRGND